MYKLTSPTFLDTTFFFICSNANFNFESTQESSTIFFHLINEIASDCVARWVVVARVQSVAVDTNKQKSKSSRFRPSKVIMLLREPFTNLRASCHPSSSFICYHIRHILTQFYTHSCLTFDSLEPIHV